MEAWRWRLGAGGLALEAWRWRPRGPSPCVAVLLARCLRCLSLLARRGSAWHAAWRVSAVQALGAAGLKRGAGLTLKMKTRVNARLPVAPRGATCWYGSTHASYGVRFSIEHKPRYFMKSPTQTGSMNSATNSVPEIVEEVCRRTCVAGRGQLQIEQTGAGSTVKYHGMYGAKDAVAQLAGTLPQRAVVPCFVRGARLRVCVRVSALRVCSAWLSGKRDQTTFGPASAANSWPSARRSRRAHQISAARSARASRATWTSASRFEVREAGACAALRVCACVVSCCPACILFIVPVAAPAILSFSMRVLCVFIDLLRSPSLRRDGVDGPTEPTPVCELFFLRSVEVWRSIEVPEYLQKWGLRNRSQIPSDSEKTTSLYGRAAAGL